MTDSRGVRPFLTKPAAAPAAVPPSLPPGEHTTSLRPFVITSGRVDGADIALETQVSANPGADPARLAAEKRAIVTLCAETLSLAEISARLKLHLGVVRILVGDLHSTGHLDVHVMDSDETDIDTILRVIRGLRAL